MVIETRTPNQSDDWQRKILFLLIIGDFDRRERLDNGYSDTSSSLLLKISRSWGSILRRWNASGSTFIAFGWNVGTGKLPRVAVVGFLMGTYLISCQLCIRYIFITRSRLSGLWASGLVLHCTFEAVNCTTLQWKFVLNFRRGYVESEMLASGN